MLALLYLLVLAILAAALGFIMVLGGRQFYGQRGFTRLGDLTLDDLGSILYLLGVTIGFWWCVYSILHQLMVIAGFASS